MLSSVSINKNRSYSLVKRDLSNLAVKNNCSCTKTNLSFGEALTSFFKIRKEVKKQEEIAKTLGVKAKYGLYLEQAKVINKALILAQKAGYLLPHNIICKEECFKTQSGGGLLKWGNSKSFNLMTNEQIIEYFTKQRDKAEVFIRPTIPSETMALVKTNLPAVLFVTLHEIGHYNHRISCVEANKVDAMSFANICIGDFQDASTIEKEIGEHSLFNGDEFIANVFAKTVGNEKISPKVMNRYNFWTCGLLKPYYWKK